MYIYTIDWTVGLLHYEKKSRMMFCDMYITHEVKMC